MVIITTIDPELPDFDKIKNLANPSDVYSKSAISSTLEKSLQNSSFANPVKIEKDRSSIKMIIKIKTNKVI